MERNARGDPEGNIVAAGVRPFFILAFRQGASTSAGFAERPAFRYALTSRTSVISDGAPNRFGGPQYPVPRLT